MKFGDLPRQLYVWVSALILVAGFGVHQWMLLQGRLAEWTGRIASPNVALGWFLLGFGFLFAIRSRWDDR